MAILLHSARHFGTEAAARDNQLIIAAMQAAGANAMLPGSTPAAALHSVRIYKLHVARMRLPPAERFTAPDTSLSIERVPMNDRNLGARA